MHVRTFLPRYPISAHLQRFYGAQKFSSRMPDSQSRKPEFKYPLWSRFEVWAFSFSPWRPSSLGCINEYLAIDSGRNAIEQSLRVIVAWLECFPEKPSWWLGVCMNRSAMGGGGGGDECKALSAVQRTGYTRYIKHTFFHFSDMFGDNIMESKLEAIMGLTALLQGPVEVGNAILAREGVLEILLAMADSGDIIHTVSTALSQCPFTRSVLGIRRLCRMKMLTVVMLAKCNSSVRSAVSEHLNSSVRLVFELQVPYRYWHWANKQLLDIC